MTPATVAAASGAGLADVAPHELAAPKLPPNKSAAPVGLEFGNKLAGRCLGLAQENLAREGLERLATRALRAREVG
jgi:hypothetical protein